MLAEIAAGLVRLKELSKAVSELDLREALVEQRELLQSAREEIISQREQITNLLSEAERLKSQCAQRDATIVVEGFRFDAEQGDPIGLPYCPNCEVKESGKLYRLNRNNDYHSSCTNCENSYNVGKSGRIHEKMPMPRSRPGGIVV